MNLQAAYQAEDVQEVFDGFKRFASQRLGSVSGLASEDRNTTRLQAWSDLATSGWLGVTSEVASRAAALLGLVLVYEELGRMATTVLPVGAHRTGLLLEALPPCRDRSAALDALSAGAMRPADPWFSGSGPQWSSNGLHVDALAGGELATHVLVTAPASSRLELVPVAQPEVEIVPLSNASPMPLVQISVSPTATADWSVTTRGEPERASATTALARLLLGSYLVGVADWALASSVAYAKDRVQFGRPIGSFQAIQHKLAQMRMLVDQSMLLTRRTGMLAAQGNSAAARYADYSWSSAGTTASVVTFEAHQVFAGAGFMLDHPLHIYTRLAAVIGSLAGGPATPRRSSQVAKAIA